MAYTSWGLSLLGMRVRKWRNAQRNRKHRRVVFVAIDAGVKISEVDRIERGLPVADEAFERVTAWLNKQPMSGKLAS